MGKPIHRRQFISGSVKTGAAALLGSVAASSANAIPQNVSHSSPAEMNNSFFKVHFDTGTGCLNIWQKDGTEFLVNSSVRAAGPLWSAQSTDAGFSRNAKMVPLDDNIGKGKKLVAECTDNEKKLQLTIEAAIYDELNTVVIETICHNLSAKEMMVRTLEPVRATQIEKGKLVWAYADRALTNGYMHYDPGKVLPFGWEHEHVLSSMWNICFAKGDENPGLAAGYIDNETATGFISATSAWYGISFTAEAMLNYEFVLKPGAAIRSGRFAFVIGANPFDALELYAATMGKYHKVKLNPVVNGWCSWFYTHHTHLNEEEVLSNARYAAEHLKPYGFEWIQIDEGYHRAYGDWEGNSRFKHGMKWLATQIRSLGLKPGLWIGPYLISNGTDVHKNHPDWLICNLDGTIRQCGDRDGVPFYGLDISIPAAAKWLADVIKTITHDWGYDFIKIDFVEWTILSAERYHNPAWTRAIAYRKGMQIIREAIGPDRILLDCGPAQITTGLVDSTRIERDQAFINWDQYAGNFNSSGPAMAKRYYFHNRTWINDADHLGLLPLSPSQANVAASVIALSGGTVISGDRLYELDPNRLRILQQVLPAFGQAARPVDLFEREKPRIFSLPVKKGYAEWTIAGLFNYEKGTSAEHNVPLQKFGLDPEKKYLAFEFWSQQFLGRIRDVLHLTLSQESAALISLREDKGVPQIAGTDRHFTQGGIELANVSWDQSVLKLSGTSKGGKSTRHTVWIYIPKGFVWEKTDPELPRDFDTYSLRLWPNGLLRLHVNFDKQEQVKWDINFSRQL